MAYRKKFFAKKLGASDAKRWFKISSQYIDANEKVSSLVLQRYIADADAIHKKAMQSLYVSALLWAFSLIALFVLTSTLRKMTREKHV